MTNMYGRRDICMTQRLCHVVEYEYPILVCLVPFEASEFHNGHEAVPAALLIDMCRFTDCWHDVNVHLG